MAIFFRLLIAAFSFLSYGIAKADDGSICVTGSVAQLLQAPFTGRYYVSRGKGTTRLVSGETCLAIAGRAICYPVVGGMSLSGANIELSMTGADSIEIAPNQNPMMFSISSNVTLNAQSLSGKAISILSAPPVRIGDAPTAAKYEEDIAVSKCPPILVDQSKNLNRAINLAKKASR